VTRDLDGAAKCLYAVTCYDEVVNVLRNPATFISGNGISMNDDVNSQLKGSTVNSDGDEHDNRRRVTAALADFQRKPMKNNSLFLILRKAVNWRCLFYTRRMY
jgi:cytochrome P450